MSEAAKLRAAAEFLAARGVEAPQLVLVLGSGFRRFAEQVAPQVVLPCADVPHWPTPRVQGHGAELVVGGVAGRRVACLTGRVHLYEGHSAADVVRAVRTLRVLGAPRFLLTNAAGGIDPSFRAGDLMVLRDHLNLTGTSPLLGAAEPELGPRFPDQSAVYSAALAETLRALDPTLREGVYAGNLGPAYETPAEVRMLAAMGAHAVGMSTVHEATAVHAMGGDIAALSLIANPAAGLGSAPLDHEEVVAEGRRAEVRLADLLRKFCAGLPSP